MGRLKKKLVFIGKKFLRMALLLLGVSLAAFALTVASPIDPVRANVGETALGGMGQEQIARLESYWGADRPPVERYCNWLGGFVRGDMGVSLLYRRDVAQVIGEKLGNSLLLLACAWVISGVLGFALGVLAGAKRGGSFDKGVRGYCLLISSTPVFWLALLLLLVFGVWLGMFPIGLSVPAGVWARSVTLLDRLRHAVLPALTLSVTGIANIALHTREKMCEIMESEFVLFARTRGERTWQIVRRHALRNVLSPALTLQFASISEIFGGSVLAEQVFSYPGLGQAAVSAGIGGDMPLLLGITVVSAAFVFAGNFIADLLYGVLDPRIGGVRA